MSFQAKSLPKRIVVSRLVSGRYEPGSRPTSWEDRLEGTDQVETDQGEIIDLISSGGQSSPGPGWELLLTEERVGEVPKSFAYKWTLYGLRSPGWNRT